MGRGLVGDSIFEWFNFPCDFVLKRFILRHSRALLLKARRLTGCDYLGALASLTSWLAPVHRVRTERYLSDHRGQISFHIPPSALN